MIVLLALATSCVCAIGMCLLYVVWNHQKHLGRDQIAVPIGISLIIVAFCGMFVAMAFSEATEVQHPSSTGVRPNPAVFTLLRR